MSEQSTRMLLGLAGAASFVFYIMAIVFGLQADLAFSGRAFTYLGLAVLSTIVALILYRRYTHMRQIRWQDEMKASEEKMRRLLTEESDKAKPE
jgi:membrane protein implicated in regulation of membrane protease activity